MAQKIELFTTLEEYTGNPEQDDAAARRALALAQELDLEGQLGLFGQDIASPVQFPFRPMRKDEELVYSIILPEKTALERYADERIPLRVLELAKTAKKGGFFKELVIWHQAKVTPDPLLVGMRAINPAWTWSLTPFIIARWGDVLDSFATLSDRACAIWKAKRLTFLKESFRLAKREHVRTEETGPDLFLANAEAILPTLTEQHGIKPIAVKEMKA